MRRVSKIVVSAGFVVALATSAACGGSTEPTPVVTPVAPPTQVDTFSGVILQSGNFQYQFKVNVSGQVLVTLKSVPSVAVDPDPNAVPPVAGKPSVPVAYPLNMRIGQSTLTTLGLACANLKEVTTPAGSTPQLTGQALFGTFCVDVSDKDGTLP